MDDSQLTPYTRLSERARVARQNQQAVAAEQARINEEALAARRVLETSRTKAKIQRQFREWGMPLDDSSIEVNETDPERAIVTADGITFAWEITGLCLADTCPTCGKGRRSRSIKTLADLGDLLDSENPFDRHRCPPTLNPLEPHTLQSTAIAVYTAEVEQEQAAHEARYAQAARETQQNMLMALARLGIVLPATTIVTVNPDESWDRGWLLVDRIPFRIRGVQLYVMAECEFCHEPIESLQSVETLRDLGLILCNYEAAFGYHQCDPTRITATLTPMGSADAAEALLAAIDLYIDHRIESLLTIADDDDPGEDENPTTGDEPTPTGDPA